MQKLPRLTSEQRANLVAYLDGELDQDDAHDIEQALASNETARHDIEVLSRTWDLLDELPRPRASTQFAADTLAAIRVEDVGKALSDRRWYEQTRRGAIVAVWTAALAAAAILGFATTNHWIPTDTDLLQQDFQVIYNLDVYREVEEIDYLRELKTSGLFDGPPDTHEP
jgi:anti-sigma factor RsiW